MVKTSMNITNTQARLEKALNITNTRMNKEPVDTKIQKSFEESIIQTGTLINYYPDEDRCDCRLKNGSIVTAKVMHRYTGGLIEQYTPDGDYDYEASNGRVIIHPRIQYKVLLICLNDDLSDYVLLGYYLDDEEFKPIGAGLDGFKLSSHGAVDEYFIQLENGHLTLKLSNLELYIGGAGEDFIEYIQGLINKLKELDKSISELDEHIEVVNSKLNRFSGETIEHFIRVDNGITGLDNRVTGIEEYLLQQLTERVIILEEKVKILEEALEHYNIIIKDLEERLIKLEEEGGI